MKKYSLVFFTLLMLIQNSIIRPQISKQALIFSIDVSKSMLQPPGFYNTLKENIKTFIKNDVQLNDLVTIYSFGDDIKIISDVTNFKITGTQDIERLTQFIDKLIPTDNNTYLTKAIDIMATQMSALQEQYKTLPIKAYLFTDGKNDPPTGTTELTLKEILSKHNTVFKNPFTFTYIITLGTRLDKDLEEFVKDPSNGIQESKEDKNLSRKTINIIPSYQIIKINITNKKSVAKFQYRSINNISNGTIRFALRSSQGISLVSESKEFSFTNISAGEMIELPIEPSSDLNGDNYKLKFQIFPVNDNFEVIPKEVIVELKMDSRSIKIYDDSILVSASNRGESSSIIINGENQFSKDVKLIPILDPANQNITFENEFITVPAGKFEKEIKLKINPMDIGEYPYSIVFNSVDSEVNVDKKVKLILKIEEPYNWGPINTIIIIVVLLGALAGLAFLFFYLIDKEFAKYTVSGMGLKKEPLNNFKKFYKTNIIIGSDLFSDIGESVVTIKANLKTPFNKKLILDWHGNEENTSPKDVLSYTSLNDMQVQFNKKFQFAIEKIL